MKIVDANVLLYAVNKDSSNHDTAVAWLDHAHLEEAMTEHVRDDQFFIFDPEVHDASLGGELQGGGPACL